MTDAFPSARAVRDSVASGRTTASEVCREALDRISRADPQLNAFRTVSAERALARAAALDARADRAQLPLLGVPVAVKDNICTRDAPTTAGSKMLEGFIPPYDATVVERLEAAGAVIVGKTNCDEFAMGSSTENSAFGPTRNPRNLERTPGGSSGGSAAAVAAGCVPLALGSDTGGSIRQPASLCGVVGFKPSYGRVSRYGLVAFASSLDQVGPLTTTVADAALAVQVLAGPDPRDATASAAAVPDFLAAADGNWRGLRIGVPRAWLASGIDAEVSAAFERAIDAMREAGVEIVDIALPHSAHALAVYQIVNTAEASSNLARYDAVRYGHRATEASSLLEMYEQSRGRGFGLEVKRRIMLGTFVLSAGYYEAYYGKAQRVRALIAQEYDAAFERVDTIVTPTSPTPAFPLGERVSDPVRMYLSDVFTVGANLCGLPAISVPCGVSTDGLPVGLQFTGRHMQDDVVLRTAAAYERTIA